MPANVGSEFVIGAVFDGSKAVSGLNDFIKQVESAAAQASVRIAHAVSSGTVLDDQQLQRQMKEASNLSERQGKKAKKQAHLATSDLVGGIDKASEGMIRYASIIKTTITKVLELSQALGQFGGTNKRVMGEVTAAVRAYAAEIQSLAAVMNVPTKDLLGSMAALGDIRRALIAQRTKMQQLADSDKSTRQKALKDEQTLTELVRSGVSDYDKRSIALNEELSFYKDINAKQKAYGDELKNNLRTKKNFSDINDKHIRDTVKQQAAAKGLSEQQAMQLHWAEQVVQNNRAMEKSSKAVADLSAKTEHGFRGVAKQTLFAAANLAVVAKRVILWSSATAAIFSTMQAITGSFRDAIDLQDKMIQIAKIKPFGFEVEPLRQEALDVAKRYGIEIKEIAETMRVFAQQGKNTAEIIELINIASKGVVATNLTMNNSVQLLTAAMNIFQLSASEAGEVLDKIQAVQANYAVTAEDLANAMRLLGPVVRALGSDMDFLFGSVTALAESTRQSGKFIGNALKTIFARLPKKDSVFLLNSLNIALFEGKDALRPLDEILGQVADNWDHLSDAAKLNLAVTLGGIRRYNIFMALMQDYDKVIEASQISMTALGAAHKAQQKELASYSRRLSIVTQELKAQGIEIVQSFIPALIRAGEVAAVMVNSWTVGILGTTLLFGGMAKKMLSLVKSSDTLAASFLAASQGGNLFTQTAKKFSAVQVAITGKMAGTNSALTGFSALMAGAARGASTLLATLGPIVLVATAVGLAISGISKYLRHLKDESQKADRALNEVQLAAIKLQQTEISFQGIDDLLGSFAQGTPAIEELILKLDTIGLKGGSLYKQYSDLEKVMNAALTSQITQNTQKEFNDAADAMSQAATNLEDFAGKLGDAGSLVKSDVKKLAKYLRDGINEGIGQKGLITNVLRERLLSIRKDPSLSNEAKEAAASLASIFDESLRSTIRIGPAGNIIVDESINVAALTDHLDDLFKSTGYNELANRLLSDSYEQLATSLTKDIDINISRGQVLKQVIETQKNHLSAAEAFEKVKRKRIATELNLLKTDFDSIKTTKARVVSLTKLWDRMTDVVKSMQDQHRTTKVARDGILDLNKSYNKMLISLEEIDNKFRTQEQIALLLGQGYDKASESAKKFEEQTTLYATEIAKLPVLQYKLNAALRETAAQESLMSNQSRSSSQTIATNTEKTIDSFQSKTEAAFKANEEMLNLIVTESEYFNALPAITSGLGKLNEGFLDYVANLKNTGKESKSWSDYIKSATSNLTKFTNEVDRANIGLDFLASPFKVAERERNSLYDRLVDARLEAKGLGEDIDSWKPSLAFNKNLLESVTEEAGLLAIERKQGGTQLEREKKALNKIALLQEQITLEEKRILALKYLKFKADNKAAGLAKEIEAIDTRRLYAAQALGNLRAKQTAEETKNQLEIFRLQTGISRREKGSIQNLHDINRIYDINRQTIIAGIKNKLEENNLLDAEQEIIQGINDGLVKKLGLEMQGQLAKLEGNRLLRISKELVDAENKALDQQKKRMRSIIDLQTSYIQGIGDLATSPLDAILSVTSKLVDKEAIIEKKYSLRRSVLDKVYEQQRKANTSAGQRHGWESAIVDKLNEQARQEHLIATLQAESETRVEKLSANYDKYISDLEKSLELYTEVRGAILNTVGDMDKILDSAHTWRDLMDDIASITFKKGIEGIFDTSILSEDDVLKRLMSGDAIHANIIASIDETFLNKISESISNALSPEEMRLNEFRSYVTKTLGSNKKDLVVAFQEYVNLFWDNLRQLAVGGKLQVDDLSKQLGDTLGPATTGSAALESAITGAAGAGTELQTAANMISSTLVPAVNSFAESSKYGKTSASTILDAADMLSVNATQTGQAITQFRSMGTSVQPMYVVIAGQKSALGITDPELTTNVGALTSESKQSRLDTQKVMQRFTSVLSIITLLGSGAQKQNRYALQGMLAGGGTGIGLASSLSSFANIGPMAGIGFGIFGSILGIIGGTKRDREEARRRREEERKEAEERRKLEMEAMKQRSAILDSMERSTLANERLNAELLFAPSGFKIPSYALRGGGLPGGGNVEINVTVPVGAEAETVGRTIAEHVRGIYENDGNRQSSRSDTYF